MSPLFFNQKMAQKEPEKKIPSTAAKATWAHGGKEGGREGEREGGRKGGRKGGLSAQGKLEGHLPPGSQRNWQQHALQTSPRPPSRPPSRPPHQPLGEGGLTPDPAHRPRRFLLDTGDLSVGVEELRLLLRVLEGEKGGRGVRKRVGGREGGREGGPTLM
jgi:hypothetical protein